MYSLRYKRDKGNRQSSSAVRMVPTQGALDTDADILRRKDSIENQLQNSELSKNFTKGDRVQTPDGSTGVVVAVIKRTGSIDVQLEGFRKPKAYAASALTKISKA